MAYEDNSVYSKFRVKSKSCSCEGECSCDDTEKCGCCPIGLVAVYNENGKQVACLTPPDAQEWNANNIKCADGFVALFKEGETPKFRGCVESDGWAALYAILNPI